MPEAISVWLDTNDIVKTETVRQNILNLFELDFVKYTPAHEIPKLSVTWNSIPN